MFYRLIISTILCQIYMKVQVGNDQEKAHSERLSHSKSRGGNKLNCQLGSKKTYRKPSEQLFPKRRSIRYTNLTKSP